MTTTTKFTEQQIKNYRSFERVRAGGRFNMFDPRAASAASLTREEMVFTMENYEALQAQAGGSVSAYTKDDFISDVTDLFAGLGVIDVDGLPEEDGEERRLAVSRTISEWVQRTPEWRMRKMRRALRLIQSAESSQHSLAYAQGLAIVALKGEPV